MKTTPLTLLLASAMLLFTACASGPRPSSLLEEARTAHMQAQGNPKIATHAALEMQSATEALARADAAARARDSAETVDKLAYLAKQKIALATEVASRKSSESEIAGSAAIRDQVRLDQRTLEAEQARIKAQDAERSAQAARDASALAIQQKNQAQADASEAQRLKAESDAKRQQLEAQLAELSAKKTERGHIITLGDVLFGVDQARLTAGGLRVVQRVATVLQENPTRTVLVEGFADSTGAAQYNQELSERRAFAVRDALLELGVGSTRVSARGFGELYPVAANDTAQNRQLNRRVEIVLSDEHGAIGTRVMGAR